jgi:transglutaminase-like putative cysteine protease
MKSYRKVLTLILFIRACTTFAQISSSQKVHILPEGNWVEELGFNESARPSADQKGSYYYLLLDYQEDIMLKENYVHRAYKILTTEGIQEMSDINLDFDPSYEDLTIHQVVVSRGGNRINQLSQSKIKVIQREESMDRFLYDGSLTAIIHLSDVRVGDIIEYSYTRKGYNPVDEGHVCRRFTLDYAIPYEKAFYKLIVEQGRELNIRNVNTEIVYSLKNHGKTTAYSWTLNHNKALVYDNHTPEWYDPAGHILISDFKTWNEVAKWASILFKVSDHDKKIINEQVADKFDSTDSNEFALQAIRFVQDDVRYLGFEGGLNSHKPNSPTKVYEQRFGDCKDKSLLLATILQTRNIAAYPVLVSTQWKEKSLEKLPSPYTFNHCVVQIRLDGKLIYVDPTISNQGGTISNTYFPPYGKGLAIDPTAKDFVTFGPPTKSTITEEQIFDLTTIGGEAILRVRTIYTGGEADFQRSEFAGNTHQQIQKNYLTFYGNLYPDIQKFDSLQIDDNRSSNSLTVEEKYKISNFWKNEREDGKIFCDFYPQSLENFFNVTKSTQRNAPYSLVYPIDFTHHIQINLPEKWNLKPHQEVLEGDAYRYEYLADIDNRNLDINLYVRYKTKGDHVTLKEFGKFVADHQKMISNLGYSISYNKSLQSNSESKWPFILTSIFSVAIGLWLGWWLYRKYDPMPYFTDIDPRPIGGWLVLVAFGLTLSPIKIFIDFFTNQDLLNGATWTALLNQGNYGLFMFVLIEHVYNIINIIFSVMLVFLFYKRRSSVPRLITIYYLTSCLVQLLDAYAAIHYGSISSIYSKELIQSIVTSAIWVPYFNISSRVKETFVNRSDNYVNEASELEETAETNGTELKEMKDDII